MKILSLILLMLGLACTGAALYLVTNDNKGTMFWVLIGIGVALPLVSIFLLLLEQAEQKQKAKKAASTEEK